MSWPVVDFYEDGVPSMDYFKKNPKDFDCDHCGAEICEKAYDEFLVHWPSTKDIDGKPSGILCIKCIEEAYKENWK